MTVVSAPEHGLRKPFPIERGAGNRGLKGIVKAMDETPAGFVPAAADGKLRYR